ncbi:MAG: hypothetical protein D6773_10830 [Alphaproteobacteria bacterium]|nr:MAG: hypothetical protein D6773_10830 [Alphaproteobacteria bacterium]
MAYGGINADGIVGSPLGNADHTYPLAPSAQKVNVLFLVDASTSMFVDHGVGMSIGDLNGDGVANTRFDLAYDMISDFIAEIEAQYPTATRAIRLLGCCTTSPTTVAQDYTQASDLAAWSSAVVLAGAAGPSDLDVGVSAAVAWFSSISATSSDINRIIILADGENTYTNAPTDLATWITTYAGRVSARYIQQLTSYSLTEWNVLEVLTSDGITEADPEHFAYDLTTGDAALTISTVFL